MPTKTKPTRRAPGAVKKLAEALNLTTRRTSDLLKEGCPLEIEAAKAWRGGAEPVSDQVADDSPAELRRRRIALLTRQEQKIALEIEVRKGQLIDIGTVTADFTRCYSQCKMRFLALPHSLPGQLSGLSEGKISDILRKEIYAILTDLSEAPETIPPIPKDER